MKRFILLSSLALTMVAFVSVNGLNEVINGIKSGNAAQVAKYFDNTVEISLPGKNNNFSKSQAEVVLRDFFKNNPVRSFTTIHSGENRGSEFCIGNLVTSSGTYRTTIQMKQKGDAQVLQELKFDLK